jgi:integrase
MGSVVLLDAAGRRRSVATLPGHHCGRAPRNKGMRYPADPPTVEEIIAVMRHAGDRAHGLRLRGLIVVLWRAGLRISEALALTESDLDEARGAILVRHGKNDKRREVGMDQWGWELLRPWLAYRIQMPVGPLLLRHRRPHPRPSSHRDERAPAAAPHGGQGECAAALCAASACATRTRSRWPGRAWR